MKGCNLIINALWRKCVDIRKSANIDYKEKYFKIATL